MTVHLKCEHCGDKQLDVMPLAVAITTGSKNIPQTTQKILCEDCRHDICIAIRMVMFSRIG